MPVDPLIRPRPPARSAGSRRGAGKPAPGPAGPPKRTVLIAGGVLVAIVIGLYFRSKSAAAASQSSAAPAAADTGALGGASGGSAQTGQDFTPFEDLAFALNGLTGVLGGGGGTFNISSGGAAPSASVSAPTADSSALAASPTSVDPNALINLVMAGQAPASSLDSIADPSTAIGRRALTTQQTIADRASGYKGSAPTISGLPFNPAVQSPTGYIPPQSIPTAPHSSATNIQPSPTYVHSPGADPAAAKRYTTAASRFVANTNKPA